MRALYGGMRPKHPDVMAVCPCNYSDHLQPAGPGPSPAHTGQTSQLAIYQAISTAPSHKLGRAAHHGQKPAQRGRGCHARAQPAWTRLWRDGPWDDGTRAYVARARRGPSTAAGHRTSGGQRKDVSPTSACLGQKLWPPQARGLLSEHCA